MLYPSTKRIPTGRQPIRHAKSLSTQEQQRLALRKKKDDAIDKIVSEMVLFPMEQNQSQLLMIQEENLAPAPPQVRLSLNSRPTGGLPRGRIRSQPVAEAKTAFPGPRSGQFFE
jgi:hypothetical protein